MEQYCAVVVALSSISHSADLPICASSNKLAAQYTYDKSAADVKYKGKVLVVKGVVHQVNNPREVDLKSEGLYLVRCSGLDFRSLTEGQQVTLQCKGDGTFSPITLSSCLIVSPQTACVPDKQTPVN